MSMGYNSPHHQGTPPGGPDRHRVRSSRSVRRQRLFAGVGVVLVVVVIVVSWLLAGCTGGTLFESSSGTNATEETASGRIAFVSDRDGDDEIYVMNADGSGVEQLTDECSSNSPAWSPDGSRMAFGSRGGIYVMNADGSGMEQQTGNSRASCAEIFFSDRDGEWAVYVRNADGSVELVRDYDSATPGDGGPVWSPDGGRIAFHSGRGGDGVGVYVMNADGSGVERLADTDNDFSLDVGVSWSPDGGQIAFVSNRDGDRTGFKMEDHEIYVMNADGSGVVRLTDDDEYDTEAAWSADGGRIAFYSRREGGGIYVMNADGGGVVRLADGYSPAWSPLLD